MWGTVGSGLTPGSRLGRQTGSGTDGSGSRTEKRFQMVPPISILHLTKVTGNLYAQHSYNPIWGTVGSGVTAGSPQDGSTEPEPIGSGSRTEKRFHLYDTFLEDK